MFQVCIPLPVVYGYPNEQNWVCELYASLPKSGSILLITQRCLFAAQASSSFECLDMCAPGHAIPTFVTEALLHLVAYVRMTMIVK